MNKTLFTAAFAVATITSTISNANEVTTNDTGFYIGAGVDYGFVEKSDVDEQAGFNLNAGYDFGTLRAEVDLDYMTKGDLDTKMVSAMGYYDINTNSRLTPFIGVGVGYIDHSDKDATDDSGLAGIAALGASYRLTNAMDLVGQYRHIRSDTEVANGAQSDKYRTNVVNVGLRVNF